MCHPDFSGDTCLLPIPRYEAVYYLLGEAIAGTEAFLDRPGAYFMKLIDVLEEVKCYRLPTGKLEMMREMACNTMNGAV